MDNQNCKYSISLFNVHLWSFSFSFMGKLPLEKLSFGKMYIWEVATWEIAHFGSCHLGKSPWEVAAWEKPLGNSQTSNGPIIHTYHSSALNLEYFFSISNLVLSYLGNYLLFISQVATFKMYILKWQFPKWQHSHEGKAFMVLSDPSYQIRIYTKRNLCRKKYKQIVSKIRQDQITWDTSVRKKIFKI